MRKKIFSIILCSFHICLACAQGIIFHEGTLDEAYEKAQNQNKLVFVDLYTSWCGPCKKVAKTIFPQEKIGKYYNSNFVCCKLDAEKGEGKELVTRFNVKGYPTFLYLNPKGELVYTFSGAKDVKGFIAEAEKVDVVAPYGGWGKMHEAYESGSKDSDFLWSYYELAQESEKQDILLRYLKSLTDEQLFKAEVGKKIDLLKTYDFDLLNRLVEGRVKLKEMNEEFDFLFTFALQWKLSGFFEQAINDGDRDRFLELLELKRKFNYLPKTQDKDVDWKTGRGSFFNSRELLELRYLYANRYTSDGFCEALETYMNQLIKDFPLSDLVPKIDISVKDINAQPLLKVFYVPNLKSEYELLSSAIIDWISYYWTLVPSNREYRNKCLVWMDYACQINPYNEKTSIKAANLYCRLNYKKQALNNLNASLKGQEELGISDEKVINMLKSTITSVERDKQ